MLKLMSALFLIVFIVPARAQSVEDYLGVCMSGPYCESSQAQFKKWFPLAHRKDYQGQRNVSFCLATGCDGAVQKNPALGCAWRLVIIASGSPRVDSTDTGFFDAYCVKRLSPIEVVQMRSQAGELFEKIYKRPLPAGI